VDELGLLERLVRRYSPSGREAGAVAEFVRLARELGYRSRIDRVGNGIAERGRGRPLVLFLGHIDTVEGRRPVLRRGDRLHGRGTVDAKGALAAALLAGRGFSGPGTFRIVAAVGEETDSRGARAIARSRRPEFVIAGEPSGWDGVTIGYKGDLRLRATFRGRRTHWSSPFPTAADRALAWVGELRELAARRTEESPFRSLTVKVVGLACDPGADPEEARVTVDLRLPPGTTTGDLLAEIRGGAARPELQVLCQVEPMEASRTDPVVLALSGAIRGAGGRPTLWRRAGTSDLNVVAPVWGCTGAAYGPGDARLDHTDRELLRTADLRRAALVLRAALETLVQPGAGPTPPPTAVAP